MHANFPSLFGVMAMDPALDTTTLSATYEQLRASDRRSFSAFAQRAGIPGRRRHLRTGDPVSVIPVTAKELAADVVVMGAVSHSGLKRVFIGNTAERVLGALPCDALVVKPPHLEKRVPRKTRGMRVVAPQPLFPFAA